MRIQLVHEATPDGRFHVFRSPEVQGLYAAAESMEDARDEAIQILKVIYKHKKQPLPEYDFVEEVSYKM